MDKESKITISFAVNVTDRSRNRRWWDWL